MVKERNEGRRWTLLEGGEVSRRLIQLSATSQIRFAEFYAAAPKLLNSCKVLKCSDQMEGGLHA